MDSDVRTGRYAVALTVSTVLFVALATAILSWAAIDRLDIRFVSWVNRSVPASVVDVAQVVTYAGSGVALGVVALVAAILLARQGHRGSAAFVVAASVGALVVTQSLKAAIRRARPEFDNPYVELSTYAFPSGHALGATATFGALAIVSYALVRAPRRRRLLLAGLGAAILVVAATRVVLGVHYLLDVLAGMVGGVALLSALLLTFELAPRSRVRLGRARRAEQAQRTGLDA